MPMLARPASPPSIEHHACLTQHSGEPPTQNLTTDDWEYILYATQDRFNRARPKPHEGKPSKEFLEQEKRIIHALMRMVYPKKEG